MFALTYQLIKPVLILPIWSLTFRGEVDHYYYSHFQIRMQSPHTGRDNWIIRSGHIVLRSRLEIDWMPTTATPWTIRDLPSQITDLQRKTGRHWLVAHVRFCLFPGLLWGDTLIWVDWWDIKTVTDLRIRSDVLEIPSATSTKDYVVKD